VDIKPAQLLIIAQFVLPGAISMYIYGLKVPQKEFQLKDRLLEAVCFSLLNVVMVGMPLWLLLGFPIPIPENPPTTLCIATILPLLGQWLAVVLAFIVAPILWPFLIVWILQFAEQRHWIAVRAKTAWDDFFGKQREGCFLQIELNSGKIIGGRYGRRSFASSWPEPGHLYIQELWSVDPFGRFQEPLLGSPGVLLRPTDYKLVRVYSEEVN
jgi:hypothetical protein